MHKHTWDDLRSSSIEKIWRSVFSCDFKLIVILEQNDDI